MGNKLQELILIPIRIWILNQKVLVGITLCTKLYWKCIRYVSLQHFLRIRKIYRPVCNVNPKFFSHFKTIWIRKWVNVFSKVIYTNFKLFVYISMSKKSSFGRNVLYLYYQCYLLNTFKYQWECFRLLCSIEWSCYF